jgi:NAD(P)H-hydrate repair Nnr-like enzyme with NAD(P)H-hydrate epimerase domain
MRAAVAVPIAIPVASLALLMTTALAGCGATIKPEGAAEQVVKVVSKTGFKPTDVTCPSGVKAEVGTEFDCHFTGPDGDYTAHMKITKVNGDDVEFYIQSKRN